ncbi:MAG: Nramp family divalent metal transporter [Verrucomicrobia bacterium]|jgi:hypothetical protein|nr:Nramp family divalent metal transporter [Verrucomicrobiota bacterium]
MPFSRCREWMARLGPGAIIASLTIGSGELVFSSRAGSLFGYNVLFIFLLICVFKWMLVYTTGRQLIITGQHPLESWMSLPGPRGWLPTTFLLLAVPCFPIWVAFHASTVGSLINHLVGSSTSTTYGWAALVLVSVFFLSIRGNYQKLERAQMLIVGVMLFLVVAAVFLLKPDWLAVLKGTLWPGQFQYPNWIDRYPTFEERPIWIELTTYVGVVGGSSYDYLCYVAFIREKGWGNAANSLERTGEVTPTSVNLNVESSAHQGIRNLRWDSMISFLCVFLFSVVFVICGKLVLAPQALTPTDGDLLTLQSAFVSEIYPGLRFVYFAGALLAMFGTLYGTLEVGPTIVKESARALGWSSVQSRPERCRRWSLWLITGGACLVLGLLQLQQMLNPDSDSINFVWILTPANLFTGVLGCGIILFATLWAAVQKHKTELPFLGKGWYFWMILGGLFFFVLGIKGYWDHSRYRAFIILAGSVILGCACSKLFRGK